MSSTNLLKKSIPTRNGYHSFPSLAIAATTQAAAQKSHKHPNSISFPISYRHHMLTGLSSSDPPGKTPPEFTPPPPPNEPSSPVEMPATRTIPEIDPMIPDKTVEPFPDVPPPVPGPDLPGPPIPSPPPPPDELPPRPPDITPPRPPGIFPPPSTPPDVIPPRQA